jgi:hypothetical protein
MDARIGGSKTYWALSARLCGLVDTPNGIRYSQRIAKQNVSKSCNDAIRAVESGGGQSSLTERTSHFNKVGDDDTHRMMEITKDGCTSLQDANSSTLPEMKYLCYPQDQNHATKFIYTLMRQMTICAFTEADRLGKRKNLPIGFGGITCRHCISDYGTGRFFPSSIKTLADATKTLNVLHTHILKCRKCPTSIKNELNELRLSHDSERDELIFGSLKEFYSRVWLRLHPYNDPVSREMRPKLKGNGRNHVRKH